MKKILLFGGACLLHAGLSHAQTLMTADGAGVSSDELKRAVAHLLTEPQQTAMYNKEENLRRYLADFMIFKLMAADAVAQGLDKDEGFVTRLDSHTNRLLAEVLLDRHVAAAKRPDFVQLAREAYHADTSTYRMPEQVSAEHILIAVNDQRNDKEALELAQQLHKRLVKKPADFTALAKEHSDDPSVATNEGKLGFFTADVMVKPFSDAAFGMKPGQLSKPVKTEYGYHIIHLLERKAAGRVPFDDLRDQLAAEQEQKFLTSTRMSLVDKYRSRNDIKVDEAAFNALYQELKARANQTP